MTKKLVIEISDTDGRTQLLKRRNGVVKFLDNIDSMFKRGSIVRAIDGVKMFFISEEGGNILDAIPDGESVRIDLTPEVEPSDEQVSADIDAAMKDAMTNEGGTEPVEPEAE